MKVYRTLCLEGGKPSVLKLHVWDKADMHLFVELTNPNWPDSTLTLRTEEPEPAPSFSEIDLCRGLGVEARDGRYYLGDILGPGAHKLTDKLVGKALMQLVCEM